jgi:citrate synthase
MEDSATIRIGNDNYDLSIITGTEDESAVDVRSFRKQSGLITFDDGYGNTGSCESKVTFIDGDKGILRYRGYPIEELAEKSTFLESAYLVIYGELPNHDQLQALRQRVSVAGVLPESVASVIEAFPQDAHPMAVLSAGIHALGTCHPDKITNDRVKDLAAFDESAAIIISAIRQIAARHHRYRTGLAPVKSNPEKTYCENFLSMMFSKADNGEAVPPAVSKALDLIFLLHADHEQNCSTSTGRMIASGGANPFASLAGAACALWGPLHGGANMAVIKMLDEIHESGDDGSRFILAAKEGKTRLMGFGHRVYRNYDPRAKILKGACDSALEALGVSSPILDIARHLEEVALQDEYFIKRKLYPNVDFYSGIILQALGFPTDMFTVLFAIGRAPGWLAHWKEIAESGGKIHRPRQIYQGAPERAYLALEER